MKSRTLKKQIHELLFEEDFEYGLAKICRFPPNNVISPLLSLFYNSDELTRWRSISAMGAVVSKAAKQHIETARVVMRRLMWNLNDESGGIGWGSPEAMGEIMAISERIAVEYHNILISYIIPKGNYLEHEVLQRGVLWGIGRLSHARPEYVRASVDFILPYLESHDPFHRGLSAWAICPFYRATEYPAILKQLGNDKSKFNFYLDGKLKEISVSEMIAQSKGRDIL